MRKGCVYIALIVLFWLGVPCCAAASDTNLQGVYDKSGASELYDTLEPETKELLNGAGVQGAEFQQEFSLEGMLKEASELFKDKLLQPLKALAALIAVVVLCKLANCFERSEIGQVSAFAGLLACAGIMLGPFIQLISSAKEVIDSASVFLLASVPVYSALMISAGNVVTGTSYSFLTLAAGSAIPLLASALIIPMLNVFLALAISSSLSDTRLDKLTGSLYQFMKWLLILLVTVFSGILSVQTLVNTQVDAATNKTVKLIASSAIPIVGGAFGDALAAIQSSVNIVKSGVGAFGILASICIFLPVILESVLWTLVCTAGQIASDLFDAPKISSFLGACASVSRMILAVVVSTAAVAVVTAAVVLFVKGSL